MKRAILTILFLTVAAVSVARAGRTVNVSTQAQLQTALNGALAGDDIILASGNYSAFKVTAKNGTPTERIVVRAAVPFGAVFNAGQLELLNCSYMTFKDFKWTLSNTVKLSSSQHIRLSRNLFQLTETTSLKWIIVQGDGSEHNRVDHSSFGPKAQLGNFITISGGATQSSQFDLIDHNYFHDIGPRAVNEMESIRVGDSSLSQSNGYTTVEYNLFENCDGDPEIVSVKTGANTVRFNTFRTSQGVLSARQGNGSSFYGNFFLGGNRDGTGGVRVYSDDHKVFNNYFENLTGTGFDAPIAIHNGDADNSTAVGADQSKHYRPQRILIAHNTLVNNVSNIEIGFTNNGAYTKPPRDITFADNIVVGNTNPLVKIITAPLTSIFSGNIMFPTGTATVGMTATEAQIRTVNPLLTAQNGVQKLAANSPAIDAAANKYGFIFEDFEGQLRGAAKDVGADEYGSANVSRSPLSTANAGLNASDFSISGRITDANGAGINGVSVTLIGSKNLTATTDAGGYYSFTNLAAGENYKLTPLKNNYSFSPNPVAISNVGGDAVYNFTGATPAAATSRAIAGRVSTVNGRGVFGAIVSLVDQAGNVRYARSNPFGYFRFNDVSIGQFFLLDARAKSKRFAAQIISIGDDFSEVSLIAQP